MNIIGSTEVQITLADPAVPPNLACDGQRAGDWRPTRLQQVLDLDRSALVQQGERPYKSTRIACAAPSEHVAPDGEHLHVSPKWCFAHCAMRSENGLAGRLQTSVRAPAEHVAPNGERRYIFHRQTPVLWRHRQEPVLWRQNTSALATE